MGSKILDRVSKSNAIRICNLLLDRVILLYLVIEYNYWLFRFSLLCIAYGYPLRVDTIKDISFV